MKENIKMKQEKSLKKFNQESNKNLYNVRKKCNSSINTLFKMQNGITLIGLVVTIIVLLILAGVSINTLFGENGIIKSAQSTKEKMEIEALRERIEVIKVNWEADRIIDSSVTVERLWQDLKDADIIEDIDRDVRKRNEATENGVTKTEYEIDTKEGYQIGIIIITDGVKIDFGHESVEML